MKPNRPLFSIDRRAGKTVAAKLAELFTGTQKSAMTIYGFN
jgi:hypothetical protein